MEPRIVVDNLSVEFFGRGKNSTIKALHDVSLTVDDGELLCIVGPSGCGKSTLLRVLVGLQQPTRGRATINPSGRERPARAMVFQAVGLFPWMTVEANVAYGLQMQGKTGAEQKHTAARWIHTMGLDQFANAYPGQLSGGMQQRVGLARAFAHDPDVLLMDEPFGALDAQTRLLLQQTLLEQWEQTAKTVVFVTHSIEEALLLGDRVCVMSARPGQLIHSIHVPFARPREGVALYKDPRWGALYEDVWSVLRDEVDRGRREEMIV